MNRDFVIEQLLRAYRSGILSEAAFEEELTRLEHGAEPGEPTGPGFEAFGRMYSSERAAVISFLDELHATQMDSAVGFAKWASVCRTKGLRTGLMILAERKAYHARVIERRVHELGGELRATRTPFCDRHAVRARHRTLEMAIFRGCYVFGVIRNQLDLAIGQMLLIFAASPQNERSR